MSKKIETFKSRCIKSHNVRCKYFIYTKARIYNTGLPFCFIIIYNKLYLIIILVSWLPDFQNLLILFVVEGIEIVWQFLSSKCRWQVQSRTQGHIVFLRPAQLGTVLVVAPVPVPSYSIFLFTCCTLSLKKKKFLQLEKQKKLKAPRLGPCYSKHGPWTGISQGKQLHLGVC